MKDTSVVMLKSNNMECMQRRVVLSYVPSSLRSSCEAGSSKQHPEMIHSFLLNQFIPISANYFINGMFSACSLCVYLAFGLLLIPLGLYGSISVHPFRNTYPRKWGRVGI